eukprot:Opistho-1_new@26051
MLIAFLVDTSASMAQTTSTGLSYLDLAKATIEHFIKIRARDAQSRSDRYMLVTTGAAGGAGAVKIGFREPFAAFMSELKALSALDDGALITALRLSLDVLNCYRVTTGVDTVGQGRYPCVTEPGIVLAVTDGLFPLGTGAQSSARVTVADVPDLLRNALPTPHPFSEMCKDPFRWDQRIFTIVLQPPGCGAPPAVFRAPDPALSAVCEATGGRVFIAPHHRSAMQAAESVVSRLQQGVLVSFECFDPREKGVLIPGLRPDAYDSVPLPSSVSSVRRMLQLHAPKGAAQGTGAFWPIPEDYWIDSRVPKFPLRTAHPVISVAIADADPMYVESFPFDKYEIEACALTQTMLARRKPDACWVAFVHGSSRREQASRTYGLPFGFLKPRSTGQSVVLFVLPYNYAVVFPLVEELSGPLKGVPTPMWTSRLEAYLGTIPLYYHHPLKGALKRVSAAAAAPIPERPPESYFHPDIANALRRIRMNGRTAADKFAAQIGQQGESEADGSASQRQKLSPADIPRDELLAHMAALREAIDAGARDPRLLSHEVAEVSVPIGTMGNYEEFLRKRPRLRSIDDDDVRGGMGGPRRRDGDGVMVDEADIRTTFADAASGQPPRLKRRRTGSRSPSPAGRRLSREPSNSPVQRDRGADMPSPRAEGPIVASEASSGPTRVSLAASTPSAAQSVSLTAERLDPPRLERRGSETLVSLVPLSANSAIAEATVASSLHSAPPALSSPQGVSTAVPDVTQGLSQSSPIAGGVSMNDLRAEAVAIMRRPGRSPDEVMAIVARAPADAAFRRSLLRALAEDALKYKKHQLAGMLESAAAAVSL